MRASTWWMGHRLANVAEAEARHDADCWKIDDTAYISCVDAMAQEIDN